MWDLKRKKPFLILKQLMIRIFLEMEPRYRNRVYIKNKKDYIDLLISKNEIEIQKIN